MTIITCEHCGPTRVAPHDINCPNRKHQGPRTPLGIEPHPEYVKYVEQRMAAANQGRPDAPSFSSRWAWAPVPPAPAIREPVAYLATHQTRPNPYSKLPECVCGYQPVKDHPDAEPGQLFAYVGQHIRENRP